MSQEIALEKISAETCFVPATHKGKGRRVAVAPGNTAMRFLHHGRITLAKDDEPLNFANNDQETALICLKGSARVTAEGESFQLDQYDSVYIPRDAQIEVSPSDVDGCDIAEVAAPAVPRSRDARCRGFSLEAPLRT